MWESLAQQLEEAFMESFDSKKAARKWQTLCDGYKNVKTHNSGSGNSKVQFEFFEEMGALIGGRHDVHPPVTATAAGVVVHRPQELDDTNAKSAKRIKKGNDRDELLEFLKRSEEAAQKRQEDLLNAMRDSQSSFERMFMALLNNNNK
jgi:hypothetical protein